MSTLSSSSTVAEIRASYMDNASYEEDGSVSKARAFVTACRLLVMLTPQQLASDSQSSAFDVALIRKELDAARDWIKANAGAADGGASGATFADFGSFRG